MLKIENGKKKFGRKIAIDNVNLSIKPGKIIGALGENGAGKTTLLRSLAGIYKLDSGSVLMDNEPVYDNPKTKQYIGFVADDFESFPYASVKENIDFYKAVYKNFDMNKFNEINEIFKINLNQKVSNFSKGFKMKLNLILNFSISPKYLLLDEPTNGLDSRAKKALYSILTKEADENNTGIVISSHNLRDLELLSDEVFIIKDGQLLLSEEIDTLKERYFKLSITFNDNKIDLSNIPGLLDVSREGNRFYMLFENFDKSCLSGLNISHSEKCNVTMEDIFLNLTGEE